jgi:branched-subunit amino acid aminotransferase/4-amino-4-deoxychorismate lyase
VLHAVPSGLANLVAGASAAAFKHVRVAVSAGEKPAIPVGWQGSPDTVRRRGAAPDMDREAPPRRSDRPMVTATGRWALGRDGRWTHDVPGPEGARAVDSWLLDGGRVRRLEWHEARFAQCCQAVLPDGDATRLAAFVAAVRAALPLSGRWFPRIEGHAGSERYVLWMRAAPPIEDSVALWTPGGPDPRKHAMLKGPDLHALAGLRREARALGCDDALLCGPKGEVVEAAHAAVVWWRGEDLCVPPADLPRVPSVTQRILVDLARRENHRIREERCRPEDLQQAEPWALNALHGIRPVLRLSGRPCGTPRGDRLIHWRTALDAAAEMLRDSMPAS